MNGTQKNYGVKRILAEFIDIILFYFVCCIPLFFTFFIVTIIGVSSKTNDSPFLSLLLFLGFLLVPISYIYLNIKQIEKKSATWGYRMVGLILINDNGSKIANKKLIIRSIIKMVFIPLYFLWLPALIHVLIIINSKGENDLIDRLFQTKAIYKI